MGQVTFKIFLHSCAPFDFAPTCGVVVVSGPGFDTRSGNILLFLLPLFQEGQLSVTGESMCTKYWLTA